MASASAKEANEAHGLPVIFTNGQRVFYDKQVFAGNPRISETRNPKRDYVAIRDFPGCRPYIKAYHKFNFEFDPDFRARPGELYIDRAEPGDYILIEPNVKTLLRLGPNKDWGFSRWQEVAKMDLPFVQAGEKGKPALEGVKRIFTTDFRAAARLLSGAKLLVTTDGALHHAAAALGIPAVVIWGGVASPVNLGYKTHKNIWHGAEPCGTHSRDCEHCRRALDAVTVEEVKQAILEAYEGR